MSKEIDWSEIHGEGDVVCTCDNCGHQERFPFEDSTPDYKGVQGKLFSMGWTSCKVHSSWRDFCCEYCRNQYIKKHT